ncbi:MAG: hypothetical protein RLZZ88_961, partial [Actinomycetota bacterium]
VLFSLRNDLLHIGVVQRRGSEALIDQNHLARRRHPGSPRRVVEVPRDARHHWALPGGHVGHTLLGDVYGTGPEPDPSLEAAAVRVLARETTLTLTAADLHQVGAFGDADRDPRSGRTVSIAYLAVVGDDRDVARHPDDAVGHVSRVQFRPVVDLLARPSRLEFDHEDIVMAAIRLLRQLVLTTPLAARFCRDQFTLGELRRVYEVLFHESLDSAENAERPEHAGKVRSYLKRLEELEHTKAPELRNTIWRLAQMMPTDDQRRPDLLFDGQRLDLKLSRPTSQQLRGSSALSSGGLASRGANPATPSDDNAMGSEFASSTTPEIAELWQRLARQSRTLRPPRTPRLVKRLDPTNFARKFQKLGILTPVEGSSRPTFDRYGKPAALFQLDSHREQTPFLLRLDFLETDDSTDA